MCVCVARTPPRTGRHRAVKAPSETSMPACVSHARGRPYAAAVCHAVLELALATCARREAQAAATVALSQTTVAPPVLTAGLDRAAVPVGCAVTPRARAVRMHGRATRLGRAVPSHCPSQAHHQPALSLLTRGATDHEKTERRPREASAACRALFHEKNGARATAGVWNLALDARAR